jgi:murein DD-endopeptidase MepM/ murein hydrolase activator NlpD
MLPKSRTTRSLTCGSPEIRSKRLMRRAIFILLLAGLLAAVAGGGAPASAGALPSATTPNAPGSIRIPSPLSLPPTMPEARSYQQLLALWQQAGASYGVPWQVLGAINKIESDFGRNMGPSSAGAVGWMQFMPSTWERWGLDANGDGLASPWNPEDAVYAAARYLAAAGAQNDLSRAIFAYNHAQWYVDQVLGLAQAFGGDGSAFASELGTGLLYGSSSLPGVGAPLVFRIDDIEKRLAAARKRVARARQAMVVEEKKVEKLDWATTAAEQRAGNPNLSDEGFQAVERRVTKLAVERDRVGATIARLEERLDYEISRLDELRKEAEVQESAVTFTRPASEGLGGAPAIGGYVFPVGGGPTVVSVSHTHHDYPAADIAAPEGSPVFAHTTAIVTDAWPAPQGRCGIGIQLRAEDGRSFVYCHLAYLEAYLVPGVALAAGASIGLVGQTGRATGPHLHLQLSPATSYPQEEAWFQSFAGLAFSWRDAPTPNAPPVAPVFTVVESN